MEELKRLFKLVKSEDREISELYLKLVLKKYKIGIIEDYVFKFEPNIAIRNSLIPGVKSISILIPRFDMTNYHYYEYDTMTGQFMNPYINSLK